MKAAALIIALATPAHAIPVATWSGPGPHACNLPGATCSQSWAETTLTDAQRADLAAHMAHQPLAYPITLPAGTVVASMAYYRDGPVMDRRGTVLLVDTPATGWHVGDWTLARIEACGNWSVSYRGQSVPVATPPRIAQAARTAQATRPATYAPLAAFGGSSARQTTPVTEWTNPPVTEWTEPEPPAPPIAPVPLPATGWMMLAAMGFFMRAAARAALSKGGA